jgi:phage tail sheath protein FI
MEYMSVAVSYPGVYIQELPSGVNPITGVATSIAVFAGWASQGPTTPQLVLSWSEYARLYGGLYQGALLGYAVSHFFANGGSQAYIIRLAATPTMVTAAAAATPPTVLTAASPASLSLAPPSGSPWTGGIVFEAATSGAANPGEWANNFGIVIKTQTGSPRFSLQVVYNPNPGVIAVTVVESFVNLSVTTPDAAGRYVGDILGAQSNYVMVKPGSNTLTAPPNTLSPPLAATTVAAGNLLASTANLSGGEDGTLLSPSAPGSPGYFESALLDPVNGVGGVNQLTHVDLFNLLCVPGEVDPSTISTLESFCAKHRAFMIVDSASSDTFSSLQTQGGPNSSITGTNGANAAFYFPWINAPDPLNQGGTGPFPPCGYVAGLYASTDGSRGVWKAPAGTAASLSGIIGPSVALNDAENGFLNPVAVNCIRNFSAYGSVIWGARTLQGNDQIGSQWKYVPVRRLALFIEESLYRGTQWAVFEPNDEPLWSALRLNIGSFMQRLFRQGAFQGQTPQDAYFVKCDHETTPQSDINLGIVNVLVGFAPLLPAEFVVIQIQQMAGQTAS